MAANLGAGMRRREFIVLLSGAAAIPLAAHAQQRERMRHVGVLMAYAEDNPDGKPRLAAFAQGLQDLGWTDGRNFRIEYRWSAGDAERTRKYAAELVALAPDVILAGNTSTVGRCNRRPTLCRSYSQVLLIRSPPALSITLRARVVILPGLHSSNTG